MNQNEPIRATKEQKHVSITNSIKRLSGLEEVMDDLLSKITGSEGAEQKCDKDLEPVPSLSSFLNRSADELDTLYERMSNTLRLIEEELF